MSTPIAAWTSAEAYRAYLQDADGGRAPYREAHESDDPDGGRAPCRVHLLPPCESTPCIAEVLSWD